MDTTILAGLEKHHSSQQGVSNKDRVFPSFGCAQGGKDEYCHKSGSLTAAERVVDILNGPSPYCCAPFRPISASPLSQPHQLPD